MMMHNSSDLLGLAISAQSNSGDGTGTAWSSIIRRLMESLDASTLDVALDLTNPTVRHQRASMCRGVESTKLRDELKLCQRNQALQDYYFAERHRRRIHKAADASHDAELMRHHAAYALAIAGVAQSRAERANQVVVDATRALIDAWCDRELIASYRQEAMPDDSGDVRLCHASGESTKLMALRPTHISGYVALALPMSCLELMANSVMRICYGDDDDGDDGATAVHEVLSDLADSAIAEAVSGYVARCQARAAEAFAPCHVKLRAAAIKGARYYPKGDPVVPGGNTMRDRRHIEIELRGVITAHIGDSANAAPSST